MTSKRITIIRLGLFMLIAFSLTWIPDFICLRIWGYEKWMDSSFAVIASMTMFAPMFAGILTRLITNEGWSDSKLHFNFKSSLSYYFIGLSLPVLFGMIVVVIVNCTYGNWSFDKIENQSLPEVLAVVMSSLFAPVLCYSSISFGEEYGWRGYMNDKLKSLTGTAGAVIIGGMIWGVWHAPLVAKGYIFGKGHPLLSILLMCVCCIMLNSILMYLTEKTGSIYPAVLFHAMIDLNPQNVLLKLFSGGLSKDTESTITPLQFGLVYMVLIPAVFGTVCFVLLMRKKRVIKCE